MKILLCHNHYQIRAGEDNVFKAAANLLKTNGHQVTEFCKDSLTINSFSIFQKISLFFKGFYNRQTVAEIEALIANDLPDIAHVHNVFPLISPSLYYVLKKHNIPIVQTIHNFRFLCPNGLLFCHGKACIPKRFRFFKCVLKKCYRNSFFYSIWYASIVFTHRLLKTYQKCISRFIFLNSFSQTIFTQNGFDPLQTTVKPNFVDNNIIKHLGHHDYFVFVGRFSDEKGITTLLNAIQKMPPYRFVLIGDGPLKSQVEAFVQNHNLRHVELKGYLSNDECIQYMAGALVSVFPYECYENCPLTIINSLWYGTPVVAADIGGVSSFVPATVGWLVKSGDAHDLATRLSWIVSNIDQIATFRKPAAAWAQSQFSSTCALQRLMDIYSSIIT